MYQELLKLKKDKKPIRICVIGCGNQGQGICLQSRLTPGLKLMAVVDLDVSKTKKAELASQQDRVIKTNDYFSVLAKPDVFDLLVEATTSIESAAKYVIATLEKHIPVVLVNAELDLLLGPLLCKIAEKNNTTISLDSGDQPGVVSDLAEKLLRMGFQLRMLGNVKGFLNRYAHFELMKPFAKQHYIDTIQCVSMTDGTKINIEQSLLANAFDAPPLMRGMEGPKMKHVNEVLDKFDFGYAGCAVEYILGAQPGGGIFIVCQSNDPLQQQYLNYYKMGEGPRYLFYQHYHICHIETPTIIAKTFLFGKTIRQSQTKLTDVYAFAKRDIPKGFPIHHSIGSDEFYGLIDMRDNARELVPIALLENEGKQRPYLKQSLSKDQPLKWYDVDIPDSDLWKLYQKQEKSLEGQ